MLWNVCSKPDKNNQECEVDARNAGGRFYLSKVFG